MQTQPCHSPVDDRRLWHPGDPNYHHTQSPKYYCATPQHTPHVDQTQPPVALLQLSSGHVNIDTDHAPVHHAYNTNSRLLNIYIHTYIHTLVQLNLGEISPAVLIMHCFAQFLPIFSLHATVPQDDVWVSLFSPHAIHPSQPETPRLRNWFLFFAGALRQLCCPLRRSP